jgi:hypothetical protein
MDERSQQVERRLEAPLLVAAVLVIPLLVIEESAPSELWSTIGDVLNWGTWLAFAAEAARVGAELRNRQAIPMSLHPCDVREAAVSAFVGDLHDVGMVAERLSDRGLSRCDPARPGGRIKSACCPLCCPQPRGGGPLNAETRSTSGFPA